MNRPPHCAHGLLLNEKRIGCLKTAAISAITRKHLHLDSFQDSPCPALAGLFILFRAAVARWPAARITLRQGIRMLRTEYHRPDYYRRRGLVVEKEPRGQTSAEALARAALANVDANRPAPNDALMEPGLADTRSAPVDIQPRRADVPPRQADVGPPPPVAAPPRAPGIEAAPHPLE